MRKRRTGWSITYFLLGVPCLLVAVTLASGVSRLTHLIPVVILGVPGAVMTFRAPFFSVSYGPQGVKYVGLFGSRSHAWADVREVRLTVLKGNVYSSDVPELVLASGRTDLFHMMAGHSAGRTRNRRVERLVTDLEAARAAAS
ncbi:PH domain-containing protein [Kitasatospora cheerisanensis]|uniref:PH domain-containing protein n=1 Tax=Kitasatospora cheerisanensis KCTC 2395 TaxID=1348663 RepID=A0A066YU99_9ACTN|nr:PH domain-containing protein [Kitasatospora cheerisanensis]KDN81510.1 hypothetical protein KCH_67480 [Kitasatospora cheerisanensis KCTC 2395]